MGTKMGDPQNDEESEPTIKICDFTTAVEIPGDQLDRDGFKVSDEAGTFTHDAPEKLTNISNLAKPLDVWSYGITMHIYLTNSIPFVDTKG